MNLIVLLIWICFAFAALVYFCPAFEEWLTKTQDQKNFEEYEKRQQDNMRIRRAFENM